MERMGPCDLGYLYKINMLGRFDHSIYFAQVAGFICSTILTQSPMLSSSILISGNEDMILEDDLVE